MMMTPDEIVDEIIEDLTDRRGLKNAWWEIDEETQNEIKTIWSNIVKSGMK